MTDQTAAADVPEAGLGALATARGNLPLQAVDARVRLTGMVGRTELTQRFHNPYDLPLEATYIFPLPARAAVTSMKLIAHGRTVTAELDERSAAQAEYQAAIGSGQRAAIAQEERPDVFTLQVGNILAGEQVSIVLTFVGPLAYEDDHATYRLPLVVAPRYLPAGEDTPETSRIVPPVILPGFPDPVALSIEVDIDPAGLPAPTVESSLHAVRQEGNHLSIDPGERLDRDFILRLGYRTSDLPAGSLALSPDGAFRLTVLPPEGADLPRPRDVVLLLDRSGSMTGWKMVAARRAAARIVDSLTAADRFAVLAFDHDIERCDRLESGWSPADDRRRYAAVEFLSRLDARGGTELLAPLVEALAMVTDPHRDRVVVLVTDGQVGNEDDILARVGRVGPGVRIHAVGIDRAVNAGFLGRLAAAGRGRAELVESEDVLDRAMVTIHRRIGSPAVTGLSWQAVGLDVVADSVTPAELPDLFPGVPLVLTGRYTGVPQLGARMRVAGRTRRDQDWRMEVAAVPVDDRALSALWARDRIRDLHDQRAALTGWRSAAEDAPVAEELEAEIIDTSLRFGVLSPCTAWVAIDERVVAGGTDRRRVTQPVELPSGWAGGGAPSGPRSAVLAMGAPMVSRAAVFHAAFEEEIDAGENDEGYEETRGAGRVIAARLPTLGGSATPGAAAYARVDDEELRVLAGEEADRLALVEASVPWWERREILDDLASRLALATKDAAGPVAEELRSTAERLSSDVVAGLDEEAVTTWWTTMTDLLRAVAGGEKPTDQAERASTSNRT